MGSTFADSDFGDTVETQLTLGTGSLLGIFFAVVIVCGLFFGVGYSFGRRSAGSASVAVLPPTRVSPVAIPVPAQPAAVLSQTNAAPATSALAPSTPVEAPPAVALVPKAASPAVLTPMPTRAMVAPLALPATMATTAAPARISAVQHMATLRIGKPSAIQPVLEQPKTRIPLVREVRGPQFTAQNLPSPYFVWTPPFDVHYKRGFPHRVIAAQSSRPSQNVTSGGNTVAYSAGPRPSTMRVSTTGPALVVQIAALSREDDAEVLASSLRQRGFAPSIKNRADDTLYHVEVGPFRRDVAFATRQRLIAKGYSAVLK